MNWPEWIGYVLFVAVPVLVWFIGVGAARRIWPGGAFFAIIRGSDHRLSLSRLQALLWTLVVFGAYAAATGVSDKINGSTWISIPNPVLALTGIALASGVASSTIAALTGDEKTAQVVGLGVDTTTTPTALVLHGVNFGANGTVRIGKRQLTTIAWTDRSTERATDPTRLDEIRTIMPTPVPAGPLIVDTANGKACYTLDRSGQTLTLGTPTTCDEWVDLFRNDQSPRGLDLMKFQMFGWTLVALLAYVAFFVRYLHDQGSAIAQLPPIDDSIVALTAISQGAYNSGKAVNGIRSGT
jgi:hypothetical protein